MKDAKSGLLCMVEFDSSLKEQLSIKSFGSEESLKAHVVALKAKFAATMEPIPTPCKRVLETEFDKSTKDVATGAHSQKASKFAKKHNFGGVVGDAVASKPASSIDTPAFTAGIAARRAKFRAGTSTCLEVNYWRFSDAEKMCTPST